jgi:hypothetical protein
LSVIADESIIRSPQQAAFVPSSREFANQGAGCSQALIQAVKGQKPCPNLGQSLRQFEENPGKNLLQTSSVSLSMALNAPVLVRGQTGFTL